MTSHTCCVSKETFVRLLTCNVSLSRSTFSCSGGRELFSFCSRFLLFFSRISSTSCSVIVSSSSALNCLRLFDFDFFDGTTSSTEKDEKIYKLGEHGCFVLQESFYTCSPLDVEIAASKKFYTVQFSKQITQLL